MKCLEKDRARRYETANGLATDIQRHLHNEPVVACPPSNLYKFQKLVRRNKVAFAAGASIAAALVIGLAIALWQSIEKAHAYNRAAAAEKEAVAARTRAEANEKKARSEAIKSQQIAQFLSATLQGADPRKARGRDTAVLRDILDKAAKRVAEDLHEQPEVEAELLTVIGRVYDQILEDNAAAAMYRRAAEIWKSRGEPLRTIASLTDLGLALSRQEEKSKRDERDAAFREALRLKESLPNTEHFEVVTLLHWMGETIANEGRPVEAEEMHREALAIRLKLPARRAPDENSNLAEALTIRMKLPGSAYPDAAALLADLGDDLAKQGKHADAESAYREALAQAGEKSVTEILSYPRILRGLAGVLCRQEKLTTARQWREKLVALQSEDSGEQSHDVRDLNATARLLATSSFAELRDGSSAVRFAERAATTTGRNDPEVLDTLASAYAETGDFVKAATVQQEAIALSRTEKEKLDQVLRLKLYESGSPYRERN